MRILPGFVHHCFQVQSFAMLVDGPVCFSHWVQGFGQDRGIIIFFHSGAPGQRVSRIYSLAPLISRPFSNMNGFRELEGVHFFLFAGLERGGENQRSIVLL